MIYYKEARDKLTNTLLNKLKSAAKRLGNFEDKELPHELFLTTRQKTKITNKPFVNNMLTDRKLSRAQLSKIIQSVGFFGKTLVNLGKKALLDLAVLLGKDDSPKLAHKATSSVLEKLERQ